MKELDYHFAEITPEDWRHANDIQVVFMFDRPPLSNLNEVTPVEFARTFCPRIPVLWKQMAPAREIVIKDLPDDGRQRLFKETELSNCGERRTIRRATKWNIKQ
jgi:hypothetical protein